MIKMISTYGAYTSGNSYLLSDADEAQFVSMGIAAFDLSNQLPLSGVTDANGNTTIVGPNGTFLRGPLATGVWTTIPSIFRLRLTGTGTVTLDAQNSTGDITLGIAVYTASNATDQIEFPYAGDNATMIRATLTGTTTAEVI